MRGIDPLVVLCGLAVVACGPNVAAGGATESAESGDASIGGPDSSSADESSGGPIVPGCGDALVEPPEQCDDGNVASGDGCNADCTLGGRVVWEIVRDGGSKLDDALAGVAIDAQDNVLVAGHALTPDGSNGWVIKADANGRVLWEVVDDNRGGNSFDAFFGVTVGRGDEVIAVGSTFDGSGKAVEYPTVRCYAADGSLLWSHVELELPEQRALDVATNPSGDVLVLATASEPGPPLLWQVWLARFSIAGEKLWSDVYPDPDGYQGARDVAVDSAGSIVYGGGRMPMAPSTFLRKLAASGQEAWVWQSAEETWLIDIAIGPGDDAFTGGRALTRHLATDGAIDWEVAWDDRYDSAVALGVAVDADDRPVTVGLAQGVDFGGGVFVQKYDAAGQALWFYEQEGLYDELVDVAYDSTNHVVAAGLQAQADDQNDIWIVKLTP